MSNRVIPGRYPLRLRREQAIERQAKHDLRSPRDQLNVLDSRLGVGCGAVKERTRLLAKVGKDNELNDN